MSKLQYSEPRTSDSSRIWKIQFMVDQRFQTYCILLTNGRPNQDYFDNS